MVPRAWRSFGGGSFPVVTRAAAHSRAHVRGGPSDATFIRRERRRGHTPVHPRRRFFGVRGVSGVTRPRPCAQQLSGGFSLVRAAQAAAHGRALWGVASLARAAAHGRTHARGGPLGPVLRGGASGASGASDLRETAARMRAAVSLWRCFFSAGGVTPRPRARRPFGGGLMEAALWGWPFKGDPSGVALLRAALGGGAALWGAALRFFFWSSTRATRPRPLLQY